jgi:hypothetical protein
MDMPRSQVVLPVVAAATLVAIQITAPSPSNGLLWTDLLNSGHAPLYGLVSLLILRLLRLKRGRLGIPRIVSYCAAFALTVAIGVMAECIQSLGSGDAGVGDVVRDGLGAASCLLAASAFDRGLGRATTRAPRAILLLGAALVMAPAFLPPAATAITLMQRDAAFPRICDFQSAWERKFVEANGAELRCEPPPAAWGRPSSDLAGHITFHAGVYPGLSIRALHPDWTGYEALVFEAYSELPEPATLVLSIHDIGHHTEYSDRFNREITIEPGANRISSPLADVRTAVRDREIDLSRMCSLVLFAHRIETPFALYLDAFRLE